MPVFRWRQVFLLAESANKREAVCIADFFRNHAHGILRFLEESLRLFHALLRNVFKNTYTKFLFEEAEEV